MRKIKILATMLAIIMILPMAFACGDSAGSGESITVHVTIKNFNPNSAKTSEPTTAAAGTTAAAATTKAASSTAAATTKATAATTSSADSDNEDDIFDGDVVIYLNKVEDASIGATVYDAFMAAVTNANIAYTYTSGQITKIEHVGGYSGYFWNFYVNGEEAKEGLTVQKINNGDNIVFEYNELILEP